MKTHRTIVVMPAYYAEKTVEKTVAGLPPLYDHIILCDDASKDRTSHISKHLGLETLRHDTNRGYGGNQKTLYTRALAYNPDIILMIHPDNQYNTSCLQAMITSVTSQEASLVLGSRMKTARKHGMPWWKYLSNRILTMLQNLVFGTQLSEFHSGLRAYDVRILRTIPFHTFSDDFVFDSEMIAAWRAQGHAIGEVDTECYYTDDVSSINFKRSLTYGLQTLYTLARYLCGMYHQPAPKLQMRDNL